LGEGKAFSEQYISMDTLEFVGKEDMFSGVVTRSKEMEPVMELALKASISSANILILGETGVGKDFIASYILSKSAVRNGPFVNVNCSAIPESLMESEFFGYGKGAFTGAKSEGKPGFFEAADGGTIFLNEIGELPIHLQAKFLNVIQQKVITRIGETAQRKVDFRLIAATNRNLFELVSQGKFREDLYYRLNVIAIHIPSLKDRKDDIVSLLNYYLFKNTEKYGIKRRFSPELLEILVNHSWPGNIRELENLVERLVVTSNDYVIDQSALPQDIFSAVGRLEPENNRNGGGSLKEMVKEFEASIIQLKYAELGSSRKVAKALGISQSQANDKIKEYLLKERK
jgi:TyrR family helix-turn-helix protein